MVSRQIDFEAILGFRDLGGYLTIDGRTVAWRKLYRSGELRRMTEHDFKKLKEEIGLKSALDLRHPRGGFEQQLEINILKKLGTKYFNVALNPNLDRGEELRLSQNFSNMGEVYLYRIRDREYGEKLIEALNIMADPRNLPLVFHCSVGKDRSGVMAAFVLSILGVSEKDIIDDYVLTAPNAQTFLDHLRNDPQTPEDILKLPAYTWKAQPESIAHFISAIKSEYGSARKYLEIHGAKESLFDLIENAFLI